MMLPKNCLEPDTISTKIFGTWYQFYHFYLILAGSRYRFLQMFWSEERLELPRMALHDSITYSSADKNVMWLYQFLVKGQLSNALLG